MTKYVKNRNGKILGQIDAGNAYIVEANGRLVKKFYLDRDRLYSANNTLIKTGVSENDMYEMLSAICLC